MDHELFKVITWYEKKKDLFDIACDYDGYDIVYEEETTDINLYKFLMRLSLIQDMTSQFCLSIDY